MIDLKEIHEYVEKQLKDAQKAAENAGLIQNVSPSGFVGNLLVHAISKTQIGFKAEALKTVSGSIYTYTGMVSFSKKMVPTVVLDMAIQIVSPTKKTKSGTLSKTSQKLFDEEVKNDVIAATGSMFASIQNKDVAQILKTIEYIEKRKSRLEHIEKQMQVWLGGIQNVRKEVEVHVAKQKAPVKIAKKTKPKVVSTR